MAPLAAAAAPLAKKAAKAAKGTARKAARSTARAADAGAGVVAGAVIGAGETAAAKPVAKASSYAQLLWQGIGTLVALGLLVLVIRSAGSNEKSINGAVDYTLDALRKFVNPFDSKGSTS